MIRSGTVRLLAGSLTLLTVATACGARVPPYLGDNATTGVRGPAVNGVGTGDGAAQAPVGVPGAATATTLAGAAGPGGTAGSNTGSAAGRTSTTVAGQAATSATASFNFDPASEAAACPPGPGNQASDVGITPTSITFGNVTGLTGVLANNFEQGSQAVQALFSAVNAHGGICGRQLKLVVEDDGQDASKNAAAVADLVPKVFAFVGSTSSADNGGVQEMVQGGVPDIGFAINPNRGQSPVYWSAGGANLYVKDGVYYYWDTLEQGVQKFGPATKKLAVLAYNVPISSDAAKQFAYVFAHTGAEICFTDYSISPATASLDQDVLQMKDAGCDGVYTTMDVTGNGKLLQAMQRQQFHPPFMGATFAAYTPAQVQVAGTDAAQGFQSTLPFLPFTENHPVIKLYLQQLHTYQPGKEPSSFGMEAWASAQMLIYALLQTGRNPTRASLVKVFQSLENWDTGGVMSPTTPRNRYPSGPCVVEVAVKGNDYQRLWPPSGMFCDGHLVRSR